LLMINEEVIEEEPVVSNFEDPLSARGRREKEALPLRPTAARRHNAQATTSCADVAQFRNSNPSYMTKDLKAENRVIAKKEMLANSKPNIRLKLDQPIAKVEKEKKAAPTIVDSKDKAKSQYTGIFNKAQIPKKIIDNKVENTKKPSIVASPVPPPPQAQPAGPSLIDSLEIKRVSSLQSGQESVMPQAPKLEAREKTIKEDTESNLILKNFEPIETRGKKKVKISKVKRVFSKVEAESSEDAPPTVPLNYKDSEEEDNEDEAEDRFFDDMVDKVKFNICEAKGTPENYKETEFQESINLEFSQEISALEVLEDVESPKKIAFEMDMGRFDDEVTGEIVDPAEKKLKTSETEKMAVSVFSDNIADAVLNIDEDRKTISSEEGSVDPFSENENRNSIHSYNVDTVQTASFQQVSYSQMPSYQMPLSNNSINQQVVLPPPALSSSSALRQQLQSPAASNFVNSSQYSFFENGQQARKSSVSQASHGDLNESPPHTGAQSMAGGHPFAVSNNSFSSQMQPELTKKISKQRMMSNTTSSVVSRDSSTKQSHVGSASQLRRQSVASSVHKGPQSSSTSTSMAKSSLMLYNDITKRCAGENNKISILYCSLLLLSGRTKEANKEINFHFSLGFFNSDYHLVSHMARLKAISLIGIKKYDDALQFLTLYKDLATQLGSDLGLAIAHFGLGYCKSHLNDLSKAKNHFNESMKRYNSFDHLFGRYYSIRHLFKINMKEKKEKEIKELQDKMKIISNSKNLKDCVNGMEHKKGTFISRKCSEILSILIEFDQENREIKEDSLNLKKTLQQAAILLVQHIQKS
jgi:tetratricopeptide (TPR) repeat protein